jgi:2,4-dienoyl-CoA reductase-like NADH-dependent reductase (Old Yellow Enzyme family)
MSNITDEYRRDLNNRLALVSQILRAVQMNTSASFQEKIKALETIEEHLRRAKRAMIFLNNVQSPRDL